MSQSNANVVPMPWQLSDNEVFTLFQCNVNAVHAIPMHFQCNTIPFTFNEMPMQCHCIANAVPLQFGGFIGPFLYSIASSLDGLIGRLPL